jgi:hypothetical protein
MPLSNDQPNGLPDEREFRSLAALGGNDRENQVFDLLGVLLRDACRCEEAADELRFEELRQMRLGSSFQNSMARPQ